MYFSFEPRGVCAMRIEFDLTDNIISDIKFTGGCNGNLHAISILADGMDADEIIKKLKGNICGAKNTSCADQLAVAIETAKAEVARSELK